jgi:hypothetical protein
VVGIKLEDEGLYKGVTKEGYGSKIWQESSKSQNKKSRIGNASFSSGKNQIYCEHKVKKVNNVELKLTTLNEKLKKE